MGRWMITISNSLKRLVSTHNRAVIGEALVTFGLGVVLCVVVFGAVFWLTWLAFTVWLRPWRIGSAVTTAMIVTGLFGAVSVFSAVRRHEPMADIQGMDPTLHQLQLNLGYVLGVPIVNRQSLAGFAALLIGGPANLLEAWSIWRSRIGADAACIRDAAQLLDQCRRGVSPAHIQNRRSAALLFRLGLIKAVPSEKEKVVLQCTAKGLDLLHSA